jgi:hypothetical protein
MVIHLEATITCVILYFRVHIFYCFMLKFYWFHVCVILEGKKPNYISGIMNTKHISLVSPLRLVRILLMVLFSSPREIVKCYEVAGIYD